MPPDPSPAVTPPTAAPSPSVATPPAGSSTVRRTLGGNQRSHATRPSASNAPPPAKPATVVSAAADAPPPAPQVESSAAASSDSEPKAEPKEPKEALSAAEEAKRLARISRAEKQSREKILAERAELTKREQEMTSIRQEHQALRQHFQQARAQAHADPLQFLEQTFGIKAQTVIDRIIGESAKTEPQRLSEAADRRAKEAEQRVAALEEEHKRSRAQAQQESQAKQVADYKANAIAPVLKDDKYALTNKALGADAVNQVWALIDTHYALTAKRGQAVLLTPAQAADIIEKHYQSQRDLLSGTTVAPAKLSATPTPSPAPAKANGQQTQGKVPAWATRKPYSVRTPR